MVAGLLVAALLIGVWTSKTQSASSIKPSVRPPPGHVAVKHDPAKKPPKPFGVLVGWAKLHSLPIFARPGGDPARKPAQSLPNPNNLGAPLVMLVNKVEDNWVQVYLPERPNESLGWTLASDLTMAWNPDRILVSLGQRHLELLRDGRVVFQATVAVGSPDSPTPTGFFYVTEVLKLTDPGDAYGPYALGLSGFSNTFYSFDGGPGQIAIHGTNQPWVVGQYASHGCVRLDNPDITAVATQVDAGTPVDITP